MAKDFREVISGILENHLRESVTQYLRGMADKKNPLPMGSYFDFNPEDHREEIKAHLPPDMLDTTKELIISRFKEIFSLLPEEREALSTGTLVNPVTFQQNHGTNYKQSMSARINEDIDQSIAEVNKKCTRVNRLGLGETTITQRDIRKVIENKKGPLKSPEKVLEPGGIVERTLRTAPNQPPLLINNTGIMTRAVGGDQTQRQDQPQQPGGIERQSITALRETLNRQERDAMSQQLFLEEIVGQIRDHYPQFLANPELAGNREAINFNTLLESGGEILKPEALEVINHVRRNHPYALTGPDDVKNISQMVCEAMRNQTYPATCTPILLATEIRNLSTLLDFDTHLHGTVKFNQTEAATALGERRQWFQELPQEVQQTAMQAVEIKAGKGQEKQMAASSSRDHEETVVPNPIFGRTIPGLAPVRETASSSRERGETLVPNPVYTGSEHKVMNPLHKDTHLGKELLRRQQEEGKGGGHGRGGKH